MIRNVPTLLTALCLSLVPACVGSGQPLDWAAHEAAPGGRIDAVADLGSGVIIAGSRNPKPGHIYRSIDYGETWEDLGNLLGDDSISSSITCIMSGGGGLAYFLTGDCRVFRSEDWGETWRQVGRPSEGPRFEPYQLSYGLAVLPTGTLLVSDTNPNGGNVFRSTDGGGTWETVGAVSSRPLYRFEQTTDAVLVNGWAGCVYKSTDEGVSWRETACLTDSPLYATGRLGNGRLLQGAESGEVFASTDEGESWRRVATLAGAADDFAPFSEASAIYSVYTGERRMYLTQDGGEAWEDVGFLPTDSEDVLDHVISVERPDGFTVIGGTKKGWIVRTFFPKPTQ